MVNQEPVAVLDAEPTIDGRRARGERNREGVIVAILDLLNEGNERPTSTQIAERSGVSVRSVFRHFDDVESLYAAAVEAHAARMAPRYPLPPLSPDLDTRVVQFVEHHLSLYHAMGTVRRVAERLRSSSPTIAGKLEFSRRILRRQLDDAFADELATVPSRRRRAVGDALEMTTGWQAFESLVTIQRLTDAQAAAAMAATVTALLATA